MKICRICNLEYPKTDKSYKDRCRKCYLEQNKERFKEYYKTFTSNSKL